ncbi:MAG TPA: glucosidase [Candidatus Binatia bacterium]|nr:glucosidase [Candidatus Binatia bacterium]
MSSDAESARLQESRTGQDPWRKWGPYLSERQWGTVREDYSQDGNAWDYFSHDQARSRAYHWGEDGIAGISDEKQLLCFSIALWNGKDPILKERLFGLTNSEGNHGEDVKEYYFYLDNTPTHSYMKYLYKYPQNAFPYDNLVSTNKSRNRTQPEYELLDTGIFDGDRYCDVFVEYAKVTPEDILIQITVCNRGPQNTELTVLPTIWFRNTWAWWPDRIKPFLRQVAGAEGSTVIGASHSDLGERYLICEGNVPLLFTENDTNNERLSGTPNSAPFVKDGINDYVVFGKQTAVNPERAGTKASAQCRVAVDAGESVTIRLRLTDLNPLSADAFKNFDDVLNRRRTEADEFYRGIIPARLSNDEGVVIRQALAGMLWSKQYFGYDVNKWLEEHGVNPMQSDSRPMRNSDWFHMVNEHVISMPDKWEYPWYAAWDLAFHCIAFSAVDVDFAKEQLDLMLQEFFLHPTGQMPAYEWNFSDVNPPVHAWAAIFLYRMEQALRGQGDIEFLKRSFAKLLLNFSWWVNRKDRTGKNVFEGGFLGLDNIGVFDRSAPLPMGGYLEQADGTAWVSLFCQNMLEISIELASYDSFFEDMAIKFADHFLLIAHAMNQTGQEGMWDEEDGFYYDVLRYPDGTATRLKVRSMVGLLPLCATTIVEPWQRNSAERLTRAMRERLRGLPGLRDSIHPTGPAHLGCGDRGIIALVNPERLRRILGRMLDENEFFSPFGIRALSRYHSEHPYTFDLASQEYRVNYLPAESDTGMFGGNSNWRGPIWMPVNALLIRSLLSFYLYYGETFRIDCPTGSGHQMNLFEVAQEIANRLARIFLRDDSGRRPVYGGTEKFQTDPQWKDYILFYEYFHGDNGAGLGASHQTGWTGVIARLMQFFGRIGQAELLAGGRAAIFKKREGTGTTVVAA